MAYKVFVDGQAGTTGLEIRERLANRSELQILDIEPELRKDIDARKALIDESDITFLCLPDSASKESVSLCSSNTTRFIDASTAFRTADDWTYGIAELSNQHRQEISTTKRLSNPGCHATGFITLVYPLISSKSISKDYPFTCYSITGYSGGGKQLIAEYSEKGYNDESWNAPRHYAVALQHKHIPEMTKRTGIEYPPFFSPILGNFYRGMLVTVPIHTRLLNKKLSAQDIHGILLEHYKDQHFIKVAPFADSAIISDGAISATACNNSNDLEIIVYGHEDQVFLACRFDNLGKGASGAAIQNMNIMLGLDESTGL